MGDFRGAVEGGGGGVEREFKGVFCLLCVLTQRFLGLCSV